MLYEISFLKFLGEVLLGKSLHVKIMLETKILGHPLSSKKVKIILLQRVSNSIFSIHSLLWISLSLYWILNQPYTAPLS